MLGKFILHYNTPELTQKLCESVPDAIVIDNGSAPDKRYMGPNRCIYIKTGLGFTKGWNYVLKLFIDAYDYVWLMNSDIVIKNADVMLMEELVKSNIYDMITPAYNSWMPFLNNANTGGVREVPMIEFTAPIISTRALKLTGLFDERFALGYGVEFDLCYRWRQAGLKMWCDDLTNFNHIGQQTINNNGGINAYASVADKELRMGLQEKYGTDWRTIVFDGTGMKCPY